MKKKKINPQEFDCGCCGNQIYKSRLRDEVKCCYCGYINHVGKYTGILMPEQIADKVPDAVATGEMWVMAVPAAVRRIDYEIVDPYVPMRIDRNGTRERFLVWYGELKRVRYQDNWRNLSTRTARNQKAVEWFMENKPDISYRTFMSNMDDELLKSFHVELQEVWE